MNTQRTVRFTTAAAVAALLVAPFISLAFSVSTPLCRHDKNADVTTLQQYLKSAGYFTFPYITGYFGPHTQAAVIALQKAAGLPQTGCFDAATLAFVNKTSNATTTSAASSTLDYIALWNSYAPAHYSPGYGGAGTSAQQDNQLN